MKEKVEHIVNWIKDYADKNHKTSLVVGVSGGIDSSVVSTLCAKTGLRTIPIVMTIKNKDMLALEHAWWLEENYENASRRIINLEKIFHELDVWQGTKKTVKSYIAEDVYKTIPKAKKKYLKVSINYQGPLKAPILKNDIIGKVKISYKDEQIGEYDLLAFENVKKKNIFSRFISSINFLIWGDV